MEPPGRNADLRAQPEFAAIGELCGGVPHHDRAVDGIEESLRRRCVIGDDRIGMVAGMGGDMGDRIVHAIDQPDRHDRVEIFGVPIRVRRRGDPRVHRLHIHVAAHFALGVDQRRHQRCRRAIGAIDQHRLGRAAHAGSPHLGIDDQRLRHGGVGRTVDIAVVDAVQVGEHRHPRLFLHPRDQALAAARHDQVDELGGFQQRAHRGAIGSRDQLHHIGGQPCGDDALHDGGMDGPVAFLRLAAAAQDHRIARAQAQSRGVSRHIGAAFIDDADHAQRHTHPAEFQPIGACDGVDHAAQRIGERRDLLHALGGGGDARRVQLQPIEQRGRQAIGDRIVHVARIGRDDRRRLVPQCLRRASQRVGLLRIAGLRDGDGGAARACAHRRDQHVGGLGQVVHGKALAERSAAP